MRNYCFRKEMTHIEEKNDTIFFLSVQSKMIFEKKGYKSSETKFAFFFMLFVVYDVKTQLKVTSCMQLHTVCKMCKKQAFRNVAGLKK